MLNFITGLGTMILVGYLFTKIRGFILNRAKKQVVNKVADNIPELLKKIGIDKDTVRKVNKEIK